MRQRGFTEAALIEFAIIAVVIGAFIGGISWLIKSYGKSEYEAGTKAERVVWQERETSELQKANAALVALEEKYRALEKKNAEDITALAIQYGRDIKNANDDRDKAVAERRAGTAFGLRWKPQPAAGEGGNRSAAAAPGTAAPGAAGDARCGLPDALADALIGLASDADKVVKERNLAVAVALKYRETCSAAGSAGAGPSP